MTGASESSFDSVVDGGRGLLDLYGAVNTGKAGLDTGLLTHSSDIAQYGMPVSQGFGGAVPAGLGVLGNLLSAWDFGTGVAELSDGLSSGNDFNTLDGIHDILNGAVGLAGNLPGQAGLLFGAAGAGLALGDLIAPTVFDDDAVSEADEYGDYKATTGNTFIDSFLVNVCGADSINSHSDEDLWWNPFD
jgi:hypothetical protein